MAKNLEQILSKKEFNSVKKFLEKTVLNDIGPKTTYFDLHVDDLVKNLGNARRDEDIMAVYGLLLKYEKTANKNVKSAVRKLRRYFHPKGARYFNSLQEAFDLAFIETGWTPTRVNAKPYKFSQNK